MSKLIINVHNKKSKINKEIYGHFSEHLGRCIYEGIYVGENSTIQNTNGMRNDVVKALKNIKVPVLRWPGGCFADEYHGKDGIGDKILRKKMINTNWGGVVEDNSFGTHEFMELCRQLGCEPYINGNVGSGTVQEMQEWVEYMTFDGVSPMAELRRENGHEKPWRVKYFGIGNENWGCGGNMRPEFYGDMYRRFQTYVKNYSGNEIFKIACGPNVDDYNWTEGVMKVAGNFMDALSLHYYTIPGDFWTEKGSALDFNQAQWYNTLHKTFKMEELISNHTQIMNKYDPAHKVGLIVDEWGSWYDVEPGTNPGFLYQQNTMRDAMIAAINLNIFNKHSDRVVMANIAQMVNVLQSVVLTEGSKMILTPTYHVFDLYKAHQESTLVDSFIDTEQIGEAETSVPNLNESVSIDDSGVMHITIANLSLTQSYPIESILTGKTIKSVQARILCNKQGAHNTFEEPNTVAIEPFDDMKVTQSSLDFTIPACSVMELTVE